MRLVESYKISCLSIFLLTFVSFQSRFWPGELESKTISKGRSDAQEIMWTLRIVQVLVWVLLCVRRERKNVPTISECIPHNKGQPRDARSEVRVNQWVYMHTAALILVCITARVMLMILGIHFHPRAWISARFQGVRRPKFTVTTNCSDETQQDFRKEGNYKDE